MIIAAAVVKDWATLVEYAPSIGLVALAFNLIGLVACRVCSACQEPQAIGMEIGIHNGTLAIAVALSPTLLDNPTMAIPAAVYSTLMFITAAMFRSMVSRGHRRERSASEAASP